eukprot:CAMPEP_0184471714 /NCGR_PEP_ID=MMETSP0740-20130409/104532_1 /TAXON_ID=385413 /ORGANISM="Thalassiosira miniscula, Strain CCMP1093" /LENGTH=50 /DNA_ID=CAMNT_0026848187 /DNA_START=133 /DNA_END=282 /DNA_ORIENTATION=+
MGGASSTPRFIISSIVCFAALLPGDVGGVCPDVPPRDSSASCSSTGASAR